MDTQDGEFLINVSPSREGPEPPAATADIVFVHGLNPSSRPNFARATWSAADQSFWPTEQLGQLLPGSRILLFSYNSRVAQDVSTNGIKQHANNLLVRLAQERPSSGPEALVIAKNDDNFKEIREATTSLVFFAVPHRGGHGARLGKIAKDLVTALRGEAKNDLVESLCANSLFQEEQAEYFRQQLENYRIFAVIEARETTLPKKLGLRISKIIIDRKSATLGLPGTRELVLTIDANHSDICRIAPSDPQFKPIVNQIKRLAEVALPEHQEARPPESLPKSTQDCLRSLAFPQIYDRFQHIEVAASGTCEWLLHHKTYKSWEACDRGLLWIKGKPGSGKSTLLKHTLDSYGTRNDAIFLSFFFHGRGSEFQKTPQGLFRSLLHQVLGYAPHTLPDLVNTFVKRHNEIGEVGEKWQWHQEELYPFFKSSLRKILETRAVWLFIDALDECGKENAVELVDKFKSLLNPSPQPTHLKPFHICFSCRHYPILDVGGIFEITLEDESQQDISTFVNNRLSAFTMRMPSKIPALITDRASGVFLWAYLVVKRVLDLYLDGYGRRAIEAVIYSIPPGLDQLYEDLIRDMGSASLKLIQWICFATRPLSLDELRWAMAIEADNRCSSLQECQNAEGYIPDTDLMTRQVQTLSCGLAEVVLSSSDGNKNESDLSRNLMSSEVTGALIDEDESDSLISRRSTSTNAEIVQFIHQSVKDFFLERGYSALDGRSMSIQAVIRTAHSRLSRICICYLKMEELIRSRSYTRSDFPFLCYATTSWVAHTRQSDSRSFVQEDLLELLAWPSNAVVDRWGYIYRTILRNSDDCPPAQTSLMHIMARYCILGPLPGILQKANQVAADIDMKDDFGRTPLSVAAIYGHDAIAQLLLDAGKIDINSKDRYGQTPLSLAARSGHESIVQLLLNTGNVDIDSKDESGRTPLSVASMYGEEAIVRLLLNIGKVDINSKDNYDQTPLSIAAIYGYEDIVQLLLSSGKVDIDSKDYYARTPLSLAAKSGHEAIVQLLLDADKVDIDSRDEYGQTPLSQAAKSGHEAIVQLLLDTGRVDVDMRSGLGQTPLSLATEYGHVATVQLLLDTGKVNIDSKDAFGRTPLSIAAIHGHEAILQLLLDIDKVNINSRDYNSWAPLSVAAMNGHEAIVQLLLDTGKVDIDTKNYRNQTPLSLAAEHGHEAIVQLLLDTGKVDIDSKNCEDQTPLSLAAENEHQAIVDLLESRGAMSL